MSLSRENLPVLQNPASKKAPIDTDLYSPAYAGAQARETPVEYINWAKRWLDPQPTDTMLEIGAGAGTISARLREISPKTLPSDLYCSSSRSQFLQCAYWKILYK